MRDNLAVAVEDPSNEEARGNMLVAASQAIVPGAGATVALGAVHSMSHPAGARYGVPHGVANAIHLPHVIRFNCGAGPEVAGRYREIAALLGAESGGSDAEVGDSLAAWVTELTLRLELPQRLTEVGVPESGIPDLVEGAMGDGCSLTNPRELEPEDFEALYKNAL
jgi:alcohol dehydrogenase class IV